MSSDPRSADSREEKKVDHHPDFSPSSLGSLAKCPGKRRMLRFVGHEDRESRGARQGSAAHLYSLTPQSDRVDPPETWSTADRRAIFKAREYLDGFNAPWEFESRIDIYRASGDLLTWGWIDAFAIQGTEGLIVDLKFHPEPSALDEGDIMWQLLAYATGFFQHTKNVERISARIYLPHTGDEYEYEYARDDLPAMVESLESLERVTLDPDAPVNPGWAQCRYCRALSVCAEAKRFYESGRGLVVVGHELARERSDGTFELTDAETFRRLWEAQQIARKQADEVKGALQGLLARGAHSPDYELAERRGRLTFSGSPPDYTDLPEDLRDAISEEDYRKLLTLPLGKLEAYWKRHGGTRDEFLTQLEGFGLERGPPVFYVRKRKQRSE